eukprot:gene12719-15546_t
MNIAVQYDAEEALSIFYITVEKISGWGRSHFVLKEDQEILGDNLSHYLKVIEDLKKGVPIQYILGESCFIGLKLYVNPSVLIPRPETEELVNWIIENTNMTSGLKILDIGTGSGCIALSLKKYLNNASVSALDISLEAINTATFNALKNNLTVNFIQANILDYEGVEKYDLIVSNPPYIKKNEMGDMHVNVLENEPHIALFVSNEEPLLFYKAIADFARQNLEPNGWLKRF